MYVNAGNNTGLSVRTVTIQTDNAGEPSGTLVDPNATYTGSQYNRDYGMTLQPFGGTITLLAGVTYWLTVTKPVSQPTYLIGYFANSNLSGRGALISVNGGDYGAFYAPNGGLQFQLQVTNAGYTQFSGVDYILGYQTGRYSDKVPGFYGSDDVKSSNYSLFGLGALSNKMQLTANTQNTSNQMSEFSVKK